LNVDYATVKYSPDSNQPVWVAIYDGPADDDSYDVPHAIAVDGKDNVYVTGRNRLPNGKDIYATVKYSPDSNQPVWVATYSPSYSYAIALAVDSNDNIYVTGKSVGFGTNYDYATIKYSPDSNQPVWVARYNDPDNGGDVAKAIAIDSNDNIYVTGCSDSFAGDCDYTTIKYSPDSNQLVWIAKYNSPDNLEDWTEAIVLDSNDNIYVTGSIRGYDLYWSALTVKYSQDLACNPQITGDFDLDCDVDIYDLAVFCQFWLDCNLDPPHDC
jgi:hypothetical protein